jgi:hypothetical protein
VEDVQAIIKKKDKERAKKEARAKQKMLDIYKRRERVALYRASVIA